jgi:hypothetical protein
MGERASGIGRGDIGLVEGLEQQAEGDGLGIRNALGGQRPGEGVVERREGRLAVLWRVELRPVVRDDAEHLGAKPGRSVFAQPWSC